MRRAIRLRHATQSIGATIAVIGIVASCGHARPFLPEPGGTSACVSSASCIESTLRRITQDLRASGIPCLADMSDDAIHTNGSEHRISFRMGTVRPLGKLHEPDFDPPTACEFKLSAIEDVQRETTPTHPRYLKTKTGRLVRVYWYMYARDEAAVARVYRLVEDRVKTLGEVLQDVP